MFLPSGSLAKLTVSVQELLFVGPIPFPPFVELRLVTTQDKLKGCPLLPVV